ncbi:ATP-binding protein [Herbaspirillum rubrisubalbicans Os34]|uniref:ATP-binding protein n=1 Tax=Herbaspirillum rubrisubalbicans Os34 TaxID=1235827 RepID=A0A6M3ZUT5_9BURK|nr:ATP-binding protein [Herbaspirillum rubrisubalbicans]QJQ02337.1 ATP-binding protein [Herbaspirillum rubrisubalbicans Os34]
MTISNYSEDDFGEKLAILINPATPIKSIEHLKGRDDFLVEIKRTLFSPGRHVFIFGDRGVGKSSLAATAATQYQSADADPIFVGGAVDETFTSIIANIALQALKRRKYETTKAQRSLSMEWRGLKWSTGDEVSGLDLASQIKTVGDAAELLKQVAEKHSSKPTVVLDEFDMIPDPKERARFASLLKQLGDQSINIKFLITGVGQSCEELLGAHPSAHRQIATIELPRLGWDARREIVTEAAAAFDLEVDNNVNWRIALISDGFPYYVHLIMQQILWQVFNDEKRCDAISWEHFYLGLNAAVRQTNVELKRPYEKAVLHRSDEFEDIVWSTADGDELLRPLSDMYDSFKIIIGKRENRKTLEQRKYNEAIRKLKTSAYGEVLTQVQGRVGWYTYKEKMLRGYVRMQAEVNKVPLTGETRAPKALMHVGNSRTGHYGPSVPRGIRFEGENN